jgi:hypothetical protein
MVGKKKKKRNLDKERLKTSLFLLLLTCLHILTPMTWEI